MRRLFAILFCAGIGCAAAGTVPSPRPDHPGHVYLEGERVSVTLPPASKSAVRWEVRDAADGTVTGGLHIAAAGRFELGALPLGWYRVNGIDASSNVCAWTTAAVLKRLAAPVPADSPVCIDTANAWFTRTGRAEADLKKMAAFASLTALAGVSGARDRLTWAELEKKPGVFEAATRYDDSARILREAGLQVLQVFHSAPEWAQTRRLEQDAAYKRYPRDLRDQYRFCKAMGARFTGTIQAWEPWNEANISGFGGHLIDEMCSLQKASYLGFKAADPSLTVCWNVFAGSGTSLHTQGVLANACWPYFDTYNIHSYSGVESYQNEFETARQAACGKPLWISECGIHVQWSAEHGDLSESEELRQARFVPKSFASTLFAGVARHYFFILGNYNEGNVQFGLLRHDLTPRRGYLALAATGRLLAGARPLGRMTNGAARVYAFRARPDGAERDVLVAWSDKGRSPVPFGRDVSVEAAYDGYGRALPAGFPKELDESPVFAVLAPEETRKLKWEAPLEVTPAPLRASCSPVVMQAILPQAQTRLDLQSYQVEWDVESTVPVAVYNLGDATVEGTLAADALPRGWKVALPTDRLWLRPLERQVVALKVTVPAEAGRNAIFGSPVTLRGDFGAAGRSVLSFRLACPPEAVKPARAWPVVSSEQAGAWVDNIVGGAKMTHAEMNGRMVFTMDFRDQDPWGYPRLKLAAGERPLAGADGLMVDLEVLEGAGALRAQFVEEGGSAYLCELPYDFVKGGRQTVVAFFDKANWGGHSRPDADGKLTLADLTGVLIGINAKKQSRVRVALGNLRWVKY